MFESFSAFHFLRPWWLLVFVPVGWIIALLRRQSDPARQWGGVIRPHLLQHLLVGRQSRARIEPWQVLGAALAIAVLALAGPSWRREPAPFPEGQSVLVVAIDVSVSMNEADVQPSRLERAKQKFRDLVALRSRGRTGLIAYAGSAHLVMPPTDDPAILEAYLESLTPEIMPEAGKAPARALEIASAVLDKETAPGAILFLADDIPERDVAAFAASNERLAWLVVRGSDEGAKSEEAQVRGISPGRFGSSTGAFVARLTVDNGDVRRIDRRIERELNAVRAQKDEQRWQDFGYFLLYPLAFMVLLWFRPGWTVQWPTALAVGLILMSALGAAPARAADGPRVSLGFRWIDLWLTPDQQGRRLFERGAYTEAALRFQDPLWKGIAYYAAEDFEAAVEQFSRVDNAEARFNRGNAQAHLEHFEEAMASYERALALQPEFPEAESNRELMLLLIPKEFERDSEEGTGGMLGADQVVIEEGGEDEGSSDQTEQMDSGGTPISEDELAEIWLRRVQTSPADFLRVKFAHQLNVRERTSKSLGGAP